MPDRALSALGAADALAGPELVPVVQAGTTKITTATAIAALAAGAGEAGVPVGGTTGQLLAKATGTDYDTEWIAPPTGGGTESLSFVDDFNRADLGATAPNGEPWEGVGSWLISSNTLVPAAAVETQLIVDPGYSDLDVSVKLVSNTGYDSHDWGILFRWSDSLNFMVIDPRPDANQIIALQCSGGGFGLQAAWNLPGLNTAGKELRLTTSGNDFAVYFDGAPLGAPSVGSLNTSYLSTSRKIGLWARSNTAVAYDDFQWRPAGTPPPATDLASAILLLNSIRATLATLGTIY